MIRVRALGGFALDLDDTDIPAPAVRPRVLALLAILAGHDRTGISRDKVIAYLWPQSNTAHARNSLKQALFSLQRAFDRPVIVSPCGLLRLDRSAVEVDVWRFESALARGQEALAVSLYRGPFLDGFYVSGLDEFERWVESERQRLTADHGKALKVLAVRAERAGDQPSTVAWWRRLTESEPFSTTAALGLMKALESAGDPTEALEYARRHAARVRAELNCPVAEEVLSLARRLVTRTPAHSGLGPAGAVALPALDRVDAEQRRRPREATSPARPRRRLEARWIAAVVGVCAVLLLLVTWGETRSVAGAREESVAVAVLPFAATGGSGLKELGIGLAELLSARLDGVDRLRSVPVPLAGAPGSRRSATAQARRVGARLYLVGRLAGGGGGLRASATLYDRSNANAPIARAEADVKGTSLFDLADALATQLIADLYPGPDERLTRVAVSTTRSLPALKAYLEGERRFRNDNFAAAVGAFRGAVRADTAFALAYYRLSLSAELDGREDLALWAAELAARFSDGLSEHDRALVEAYLVRRRGRIEEAERQYRRIVADYPEDAEAWFQLAEVLFHSNPLRGRSTTEARPALERMLALEPASPEALLHLARIAALEGKNAQADSLVRLAAIAAPDSVVMGLRAFRGFALGDRPADYRSTRELIGSSGFVPAVTALGAAAYVDDLTGSERFATLLAKHPRSCEVRGLGRRMLAQAALARGLPDSATGWLRSPEACDSAASLQLLAVYQSLPFVFTDRPTVRELLGVLLAGRPASNVSWQEAAVPIYGIGLIALAAGDSALAGREASTLDSMGDSTGDRALAWSLTQSLRGRIALHRGEVSRALGFLERARWEQVPVPPVVEVDDRYLRAELLARLGRDEEAAGWYGSIAERASHELVYLAPAQFRLAQIHDRQGDDAKALAYYQRFLQLWREAEPGLHPFIVESRRRVNELQASTTYR